MRKGEFVAVMDVSDAEIKRGKEESVAGGERG